MTRNRILSGYLLGSTPFLLYQNSIICVLINILLFGFNNCFMKTVLSFALLLVNLAVFAQPKQKYKDNQTYTYPELIEAYQYWDKQSDQAILLNFGQSDAGLPIYLFVWSPEKIDSSGLANAVEKYPVVLINNAIHPGESCGVDASLLLVEDLINGKEKPQTLVGIIPAYNVGGMLNRREKTRANQVGPEVQGFRGNANNYDLNRDFTKSDAQNTLAFYKIFNVLKPQFFIDNHTTNGADYQYVQTLIFSSPNKFGAWLRADAEAFKKHVFETQNNKGVLTGPFVNIYGQTPEKGFAAFHETPIYSTGYTSAFNTFSMVSETHMLKPYKARVEATYELSETVIAYAEGHGMELKKKAENRIKSGAYFPIQWKIDSSNVDKMIFKGFAYEYLKSEITGGQRLKYTDKKVDYTINYYPEFTEEKVVEVPEFYAVPKSWSRVLEKLDANFIRYIPVKGEIKKRVEVYYVKSYESVATPYEGHYLHYNIEVEKRVEEVTLNEQYVLVPTDQRAFKLLMYLLEPQAEGSLFSWNYFDAILQRKEGFSSYVFEETALEILENNPELKAKFVLRKKEDPEFAKNPRSQLNFIYMNSEYFEATFNRYPIYRLPAW